MESNTPQKKKKRCYYEILDVDRKAPTEEITKAYRKLALKYHPDKNPSDEAKQIFLEIQEAYQILSDVNERTWYDSHREQILLGKDQLSKEDLEEAAFGFNIWPYFSSACYNEINDDEDGFYTVYREVFEKIKHEEEIAWQYKDDDDLDGDFVKLPGFGDSKTNGEIVTDFYKKWATFSSYKTFSWADAYDVRDAPNRYVKRQIEKENKKERKKEKKSYIQTIKNLVEFCKLRDQRYRTYILQIEKEDKEKEIQKKIEKKRQEEEQKKIKQEMREQMRIEEEKRWKETEELLKKQQEQNGVIENEEYQAVQEFICQVCDKVFQSEAQLQNHNSSKNHKKKLKSLIQEVALDDEKQVLEEEFDLNNDVKNDQQQNEPPQQSKKSKKNKKKNKNKSGQNDQNEEIKQEELEQNKEKIEQNEKNEKSDTDVQKEKELSSKQQQQIDIQDEDDNQQLESDKQQKKKDKKKKKRKNMQDRIQQLIQDINEEIPSNQQQEKEDEKEDKEAEWVQSEQKQTQKGKKNKKQNEQKQQQIIIGRHKKIIKKNIRRCER